MKFVIHFTPHDDTDMEVHLWPDTGKCEVRDTFPTGESAGVSKCTIARFRQILREAMDSPKVTP
jgi:hypothetical protein